VKIARIRSLVVLLALICCAPGPGWAQAPDRGQVTPAGMKAILAPPLRPAPEGDARADVTIVEYFDYQCPVCRRMDPELHELLKSDAHIRLVYKDWPIFGATSVYAAYGALAAQQLGHYAAAHRALMGAALGSREEVERTLRAAGLDVAAIKAFISAHRMELSATLTRNHGEARALGLQGTPGILIGDQLVVGGLPLEQLRHLVAQARKAQLAGQRPGGRDASQVRLDPQESPPGG
jgi:protein-disulfide isomerase